MNVLCRIAVAALLLSAAPTVLAQQPVCLPGFPQESPVVSNSPDDIPRTNVDIITYTGSIVKAQANHNIAYVEISPNEQKVWFGVDGNPGMRRIFYNRRLRDPMTLQWTWRYAYSPEVIRYDNPTSTIVSAVLFNATEKYRDTTTNTLYKYVMYSIFQPKPCDGVVAGFIYLSFSNNGFCWTPPRQAVRPGGPAFSCAGITNSVPVEAMSAIDAGSTIYLVGVDGDIVNQLAPPVTVLDPDGNPRRYNNMNRTKSALGTASPNDPAAISVLGEITANGMFVPTYGPSNPSNPQRYKSYTYLIDMDIAWDPTTGNFYVGRAYPYAYDRGSLGTNDPPTTNNSPLNAQLVWTTLNGPQGPSPVEGCADSPGPFPNRIQIYRMNIVSLANIMQLTTGTWTLLADVGGSEGYRFDTSPSTQTPLQQDMTNIGLDLGAVSFLRNRRGELVRYGQTSYYFAAELFKKKKSVGPCQIMGTEREWLRVVP